MFCTIQHDLSHEVIYSLETTGISDVEFILSEMKWGEPLRLSKPLHSIFVDVSSKVYVKTS